MNRFKLLMIILLLLLFSPMKSQKIDGNRAFKVGERMVFDAYYNLGFLWVKVGEGSFEVKEENGNYKFVVSADNLPKWDWIYSVHTVHTASATPDMRPLYMHAVTTEKDWHTDVRYEFREDGTVRKYSVDNKYHPEGYENVFEYTPYSQDIINSVYVARNIDFTQNGGKHILFYPVFDDKVNVIEGNVVGKESIKTRNGVKYQCLKCTSSVGKGTIFAEDEPVYVWVTDDYRRIPVLVEAKIRVGSVKVYLSSYKEE